MGEKNRLQLGSWIEARNAVLNKEYYISCYSATYWGVATWCECADNKPCLLFLRRLPEGVEGPDTPCYIDSSIPISLFTRV